MLRLNVISSQPATNGKYTPPMSNDNVIDLKKPEPLVEDPITEILRQGVRKLLAQALEAEIDLFINRYRGFTDELGRHRIVRNGYNRQREIQSGIGLVPVQASSARDRQGDPTTRIQFQSSILPSYTRMTKTIKELLPRLYLRGISTGDFSDALSMLLGPEAPGLSPPTIPTKRFNPAYRWTPWFGQFEL